MRKRAGVLEVFLICFVFPENADLQIDPATLSYLASPKTKLQHLANCGQSQGFSL
jgi:hypothetical protein